MSEVRMKLASLQAERWHAGYYGNLDLINIINGIHSKFKNVRKLERILKKLTLLCVNQNASIQTKNQNKVLWLYCNCGNLLLEMRSQKNSRCLYSGQL